MPGGPRSIAVALGRRELLTPALYRTAVIFGGTGIGAAILAASLPADGSAVSSIIGGFHRTIAAIASIIAVLSTIDRVCSDADTDWLMQHTAAGGSRMIYVLTVPLCVSVRMFVLYCISAVAFAVTRGMMTGDTAILQSVLGTLPLIALMIVSAAMFGAAAASVTDGRSGVPLALVLLAAPWAAIVVTLSASDGQTPVSLLTTLSSYPPPRLFVAWTLSSISYTLIYTAIMGAIAMARAPHRICRRT